MNGTAHPLYDLIIARSQGDAVVDQCCLGLTWTYCHSCGGTGFAHSPGTASRTLAFPGTLAGTPCEDVASWVPSWDLFESTIGLAAANAAINSAGNALMASAEILDNDVAANLAVFEHFRSQLAGRKVVIIGRYPGMDEVLSGLDVTVLERSPTADDLPDPAAEFLLPQADWVFLTATSIINKTFPRLAALAGDAVTVLMGPSLPWLEEFADYGIDFLAGAVPIDIGRAMQIAMEGGGTRLFGEGVRYGVVDIGIPRMQQLKAEIAGVAARRAALTEAMDGWYRAGNRQRFDRYAELDAVTKELSTLDTAFKRQWDARRT